MFSACGLNCGLCPSYYAKGSSRCPGCGVTGYQQGTSSCGLLNCCLRKGSDYCYSCVEYPCRRFQNADTGFDSFITYRNQLSDMEKAKDIGLEAYTQALKRKMGILQLLLEHYDDGRHKSFSAWRRTSWTSRILMQLLSVLADNEAAIACFQKAGFQDAGRRREWVYKGGEYIDRLYMDMLADEFRKLHETSIHSSP